MIDRNRRVEVLSSPRLPSAAALSKIIPSSIVEGNIEKIINTAHVLFVARGYILTRALDQRKEQTNFLSILNLNLRRYEVKISLNSRNLPN